MTTFAAIGLDVPRHAGPAGHLISEVRVRSTPGTGSRFDPMLPAMMAAGERPAAVPASAMTAGDWPAAVSARAQADEPRRDRARQ